MKKTNLIIFLSLFVISLFLYFYRYPKMLAFDADQEFYANQYIQIFKEHKITLLGIETSIGGMFVGPLYTYVSSFVYWLSSGNPTGIFFTTLIFTSFQASLTYHLFTKLKNNKVGIISGLLVLFSSSLWNKAFAPSAINFLYTGGLLFFYILVKLKERKRYFLWMAILLALTLHIHFSLFLFFPITILFLIWQKQVKVKYLRYYLWVVSAVLISLLPLIIFDLRHQFYLTSRIFDFSKGANSISISNIPKVFWGFAETLSHILVPRPGAWIYVFLLVIFIFFLRKLAKDYIYQVAGLILTVTIAFFLFYGRSIPDYYFYFLLAPFFLVAAELLTTLSKNRLLKLPVFLFLLFIAFQNLQFINSTLNHYNFFLKQQVAKYIKYQSQGKKVKISYDTDLGLGFGFDYLLKYEGVNIDNHNFEENYHIVIRNYGNYAGQEFREPGSPVSIKVVKLPKRGSRQVSAYPPLSFL